MMYAAQFGQPVEQDTDFGGYVAASTLKREVFTRLSQRLAAEAPGLVPAYARLKASMDEADFEKYMESLVRIRQSDELLLVITDNAMHRTMVEGRFKGHLAKAFNASVVRVLSQS